MSRKIFFMILTLITIVSAWVVTEQKSSTKEIKKEELLPDFLNKIEELQKIEIKTSTSRTEFIKLDSRWVSRDFDNFPLEEKHLRGFLLNIGRILKIEKKTNNVKQYKILGVEDIGKDSAGREYKFTSESGEILGNFIIGKPVSPKNGSRYYARQIGNPISLIIESPLTDKTNPVHWVDAGILNVQSDEINSIETFDGSKLDISLKKSSNSPFFKLVNTPEGYEEKNRRLVSTFGSILTDLRFNTVLSKTRLAEKTAVRKIIFNTSLNFVIELDDYRVGQQIFTAINVRDEGSENKVAAQIKDKTENWIYALPSYKRRVIERKISEIITKSKK